MKNPIAGYKKEIDQLLKDFLLQKQEKAKNLPPVYQEMVDKIAKIILGSGKRTRPLLVLYGYKASPRSTNKFSEKQVLLFSLCVELFHTACLIHDDIMDNSQIRRHGPTLHKYFEKQFSQKKSESLAILAGDLALIWADEIFTYLQTVSSLPYGVHQIYDLLREEVILGQSLDLVLGSHATEKEILNMYKYKTAKYSFERPLQLGAVLSGADDNVLQILSDYAIPIGIAFQIKDDILGVFGEETGKDVGSDIYEGKETLLVNYARQKTVNSKQLTRLENILGNKNSSGKDIGWVKNLMQETGALKYCQNLAEKYIQRAKSILVNTELSQETKDFLLWLADFSVARKI